MIPTTVSDFATAPKPCLRSLPVSPELSKVILSKNTLSKAWQTRFVVGGSWLHELLRALFVSWRLSECVCARVRSVVACVLGWHGRWFSRFSHEVSLEVWISFFTGTEVLAVSFLFSADTPY